MAEVNGLGFDSQRLTTVFHPYKSDFMKYKDKVCTIMQIGVTCHTTSDFSAYILDQKGHIIG